MIRLKDSAAPVPTGATAATRSEANADITETTTNKLLNLSLKKSVKTKKINKKSNLKKNDYVDNNTQQHILNMEKKVTYLEEQNKSTQRAVAQLRQLVSISVQFHKDELARNRERRF